MAMTATLLERSVFGNKAVQVYDCTLDAASGTFASGFKSIDFVSATPISMATAAVLYSANEGSGGTSTAGTMRIENGASGDRFYLMVYGR